MVETKEMEENNNHNNSVDLANMNGWDIVLADTAMPSEIYAAEEFYRFIEQVCSVKLPVVKAKEALTHSDNHCYIGVSPTMLQSPVAFSAESFGEEDFRIIIRDDHIAIAGGRYRGTLYGVYTFLEDYLGVRFLTGDHTYIPSMKKVCLVGPVDRFFHPSLAFRWPYYYETNNDVVMATRQRTNTIQTTRDVINRPFMRHPPICQDGRPFNHADAKFGGISSIELVGHSFYQLLPAAKSGFGVILRIFKVICSRFRICGQLKKQSIIS